MTTLERAVWTTSYVNDLPDSAFLYVAPGGTKDADGKTVPRSSRFFPVKDANGSVDLPHLRNALARIPQSSLSDQIKATATAKAQRMLKAAGGNPSNGRSSELRSVPLDMELRDDGNPAPTLVGHLAVFDEWAEIASMREGHFLERIAPGAFTKTLQENLPRVRVLFNHGKDPQFGEKPLGPIRSLTPDDKGVAYEVPLLDTSYNRDLVEMLKADPPVLGSSFRFTVTRDDVDRKPGRSDHNPRGLAERTITELRLSEFGPVTFNAYAGASAGVRSLTDWWYGAEERVDPEDMGLLAQGIQCLVAYLAEQDDPGDDVNIPPVEAALKLLAPLMVYEANETEPADEPEDESMEATAAAVEGASAGSRTSANGHAGRRHLTVSGRRASTLYIGKESEVESWRLR